MRFIVVSRDLAVQVLVGLINDQVLEFPFRIPGIIRFHAGIICPRRFFRIVRLADCLRMNSHGKQKHKHESQNQLPHIILLFNTITKELQIKKHCEVSGCASIYC